MNLGEYFRSVVNGSTNSAHTIQQIATAAEAMQSLSQERAQMLLVTVILPWATTLASKALKEWAEVENITCQSPTRPIPCPAISICKCHACGRPICLNHAFVSVDAFALCFPCAKLARSSAKPWQPTTIKNGSVKTDISWAYQLLGLEENATEEQVKQAYRKKSAHCHPDRAGGDPAKAAHNADLFKTVQRARNAIMEQLRK